MLNTILIVDDEKDNLEALRRLLRTQFVVKTAGSAFEALKMIQKERYSVIVSDQRMPEMTGVELLEKVKHVSPITTRVLLTGYTEIESVVDAINRGNIFRYIAKPWDPEDLKLTLKQADEAHNMRREIEEKNVALKKSNDELSHALEQIQNLDKAKSRFFSLISHELNTPLTVLTSYGSLLTEKQNTLEPDLRKSVTAVDKATQRLSEIVGEVLTYVKLDLDQTVKWENFDLTAELTKLKQEFDFDLKEKDLTFELPETPAPTLRCDPVKVGIALRKLMEDTVRRAPTNSVIKVSLAVVDNGLMLSFWRRGELLAADAFEAFSLGKNPLHHQQNLGLSLATCKLIVEGHGGEVRLQSDEKKGTTISVIFPKAA